MNSKITGINKEATEKFIKNQAQDKQNPLGLNYTDNGTLRLNSVKNIVLILLNDELLKGLFRFNEFTEEVDVVRDQIIDLSKYKMPNLKFTKDQVTDADFETLALYIEININYGVSFKISLIEQAVRSVAKMNPYNPVIDYFDNCLQNWDHHTRLFNFFPTYLGADNNATTELITRLWFMGLVAKVYNPNTKFDYVLDLVGGQGTGKTTLLQKIAPLKLYTDQFNDFRDKDSYSVMKNALIVNDDEMTSSNKVSFEEVKKFVTMQIFEYRKPYARTPSRFKKKFVIARTTNEIRHLKDKSGDRRFITILVHPNQQKLHPVVALSQEYVNQLWGEVTYLYKENKKNNINPFELTKAENKLLKENREQFMYTSSLEDELDNVLETIFQNETFIAGTNLAKELLGDEYAFNHDRKTSSQVKYYMEHKGWDTNARGYINSKRVRGFKKIGQD